MKIIAFDLDNTFLDFGKNISEENINALLRARDAGVEPVPATGRLISGVPEKLTGICRYIIAINGAKVLDLRTGEVIYSAEIPCEAALRLYEYGDTLPCIYDAYIEDSGYISRSMYDLLFEYMPDKNYAVSMQKLRKPVDSLKDYVRRSGTPVQKAQYYFLDTAEKARQLAALPEMFPDLKFSSSLGINIEINGALAGKGLALEALCNHLGCSLSDTVAFGDESNDLEMLSYAGTGYCMINGGEEIKAAADRITEYDCNNSGVGREIEKLLAM